MPLNYPGIRLKNGKKRTGFWVPQQGLKLLPVLPTAEQSLLGRNVGMLERLQECGRSACIAGGSLKELRKGSLSFVRLD
jgi:hypothetical protein